jgi:mannosidase alpha-like ER degradation enhancer 1
VDPLFRAQTGIVESPPEIFVTAYTSMFGADLTVIPLADAQPVRFGRGEGVRVSRDKANHLGCLPYDRTFDNDAILVYRGDCNFLEKLIKAKSAGASGVVVISDEDMGINPTSDAEELAAAGDLSDVAIVVLASSAGKLVASMLDSAETYGMGQVMLMVDPEGHSAATDGRRVSNDQTEKQGRERVDSGRVLYINGHAVLNTRLIV